MAGLGAKVLQLRSVELARRYNVPLVVRSSFSEGGRAPGSDRRIESMEDVLVSGVTLDQNQSKITLTGVEDRPGLAAQDFRPDRGGRNRRRHDYPERQRRRPHRHDLYGGARRFAPRARICQADRRRKSAPPACATRIRSPKSRSSASGCARMRASRRTMFQVLADESESISR